MTNIDDIKKASEKYFKEGHRNFTEIAKYVHEDLQIDSTVSSKTRLYKDDKLVFIGDGIKKQDLMRRVVNEKITNCIFIAPVSKKELIKYLNIY